MVSFGAEGLRLGCGEESGEEGEVERRKRMIDGREKGREKGESVAVPANASASDGDRHISFL